MASQGPRWLQSSRGLTGVCNDNKNSRVLAWRKNAHFGQATTAAEGRVSAQGGGVMPYIVAKSALKAYYDTLWGTG